MEGLFYRKGKYYVEGLICFEIMWAEDIILERNKFRKTQQEERFSLLAQ
jgi:hypothetical protein